VSMLSPSRASSKLNLSRTKKLPTTRALTPHSANAKKLPDRSVKTL
jgi:hypothetical protein